MMKIKQSVKKVYLLWCDIYKEANGILILVQFVLSTVGMKHQVAHTELPK